MIITDCYNTVKNMAFEKIKNTFSYNLNSFIDEMENLSDKFNSVIKVKS